jgi:hypothetical protein
MRALLLMALSAVAACSGPGADPAPEVAAAPAEPTVAPTEPAQPTTAAPDAAAPAPAEAPEVIALFALNIQDWVWPERSAESNGVPIDIYITGPALRGYLKEAPEIVERMRSSELVAISHHARPPMPYYTKFDHVGLAGMAPEALYETLMRYETRALDMASGGTTDQEGGYALETSTFGYPPVSVGLADGSDPVSVALAKVFVDLGAKMVATHQHKCALGDRVNGLLCRPEHGEVQLFRRLAGTAAEELEGALRGADPEGPYFLWIKIHETNFYVNNSPWRPIYYEGGDTRYPLKPPYDLTRAADDSYLKAERQTEATWQLYKESVEWVAANRGRLTPMNLRQVMDLVEPPE